MEEFTRKERVKKVVNMNPFEIFPGVLFILSSFVISSHVNICNYRTSRAKAKFWLKIVFLILHHL